ncbi:conjugal transfer protein [Porphyromonas gingivalis]|uniref:conjugal transfer protein n=1 Tax=Porphyromonas gingivalis TaxID=837 RepID=UPI001F29A6F8|nr:conjugal transfer protein [Porphyromonas gingivalis]MCE8187851.1 conjugal transfer protein [Porphyromonas gingivalis]MCE8187895.1 conjugal transfer protein [Porphyromonas gingivalis]MCE8188335.1 conjugal transfer protein [Porphyromonas gingivalis]MCE8188352.1 conjugal transfer protein [Porphyromonas gingivalis]
MYRIVLVLVFLLLYLLWLLLFLLYEGKIRKKGASSPKEPCQTVCEAEIIGKSRFKISHSTPQVRSYPKGEAEAKKASTFAFENGQEPSEEPDDLPDIDEIPLVYESSDAPSFEEEEDEELPVSGKSEYATGIDFERVLEALSVIHRHAHTEAERQSTGDTLRALEGTRLMETLRSDAKRSATIDEIVRARFEELYSGEEA